MAETSKKCIQFLDAESNKLYKCCLSPEDARRASTDMVFAQHIFNGLIHEEKIKAKINFNEDDFEKDISPLHEITNRSHNINNAVSSQVSGREGMTNWTHEQTLLLINIYREEYLKIGNGKMLLRKLWQLVADKMRENGYNIPAIKCATKIDALKRQYKKVFDHNKQSGNNLMTYKYFDELDEIFRKQTWITPVAIASSELQDSTFENIDERNSSSDTGKRKRNVNLEDILEERKNKAAKTEVYRNEKLSLMKELIQMLKKSNDADC